MLEYLQEYDLVDFHQQQNLVWLEDYNLVHHEYQRVDTYQSQKGAS